MNKTLRNILGTGALITSLAMGNKAQAQQRTDIPVSPYEISVDSTEYHKKLELGNFDYIIPFNDALRISNLENQNQSAAQFASKLVNGARRTGAKPENNKLLYVGLTKNPNGTFTASYITGSTYKENVGSLEEMRYNKDVDWSLLATAAQIVKYNYENCDECYKPQQEANKKSPYLGNIFRTFTVSGDYFISPNEDEQAAKAFNFADSKFRLNARLGLFGRISPEVGLYFNFEKEGTVLDEKVLLEEELRSGRVAKLVETTETDFNTNKTISLGGNVLVYTNGNKAFSIGGGVGMGTVSFKQSAEQKELYYFGGELEGQGTLPVESNLIESINEKIIAPYGYVEGKIGPLHVGLGVEYSPNGTVEFQEGTPKLADDLSLFGRIGLSFGNYKKR